MSTNMKVSQLQNGYIVELRNGDRYIKIEDRLIQLKDFANSHYIHLDTYKENGLSRYQDEPQWDITKVYRSKIYDFAIYQFNDENSDMSSYWSWERPAPVLDEVEKAYLKGICAPFEVIAICKNRYGKTDHISIQVYANHSYMNISLPTFKADKMYKGMQPNRDYTLEELGIE